MIRKLEDKLFKKYPKLFKYREAASASSLCFGFECDDGWFPIIYLLCEFLNERYKYWDKEIQEGFYVTQIKEKFGGLRFYTSILPECTIGKSNKDWGPVFSAIQAAENISMELCEVCGSLGTRTKSGWIQTLCKTHKKIKETDRIE